MNTLNSNFFKKQEKNSLKNDGLLFENLVENLLNLEFGHLDWKPTKQSWDGAKDFIGRKNGALDVWAECKMYQHTLQLAVISKTLVMAINYKVNRILIFSWSKLTPGAMKELASFSASSKIQVQIFDDELLEALILKHIKDVTIRNFFPNINDQNLKELALKPKIKQFFTTSIQLDSNQVDHSKNTSNPRSRQIQIDTPCMFQITVYPNSIEPATIVIDLSKFIEKEHILEILNKDKLGVGEDFKISKKLSPGEIYSLKIYFVPSQIGAHEIPVCEAFMNNSRLRTKAEKFNVIRLTRPTLVGARVIQALKDFHDRISNNDCIYTTVINGLGGAGKSRFLEECISKLLSENYRICKLDGKSIRCKNINSFAIELLTQLWRVPNPKIFKDELNELELQTLEKDNNYSTYLDLYETIKTCAFSNQAFVNEIEDKIHQLLQEGFLKQSRIAILIDNVQSLDNKSISLVRKLTEQTSLPGQNVALLTFNIEELIYSHEATSFYQNLKEELSDDDLNSLFLTLNEFSKEDVILFVNTHLKNTNRDLTFSEQYPLLFELICKHIQPRPLDLYLFFHLLVDEGAVELDEGIFFINDFEIFNNVLIGVEKTTENILAQRLDKLKDAPELLDVLILLMYFGEIDVDSLTERLNIQYETIERLANGCWIKVLTDKRITFYHPKIERFIIDKEFNLLNARGTVVFTLLNNKINLEKYPLIYFAVNPTKDQILPKAVDELLKLSTLNARNKLFATKIYNYVTGKFSNVVPSVYLKAVPKICALIAENSTVVIIEKLSHFHEVLNDYTPKESEAKLYFQIIRQHASYLCAKDPYKSISIINDGLSKLDRIKKDFSEDIVDFIDMNLKNRLSFCYRTIRNQDKAREIGEEALQIAKKINNMPFVCLCYVDLGYIFLEAAIDKNKMIEYWSEAVRFFDQNKEDIHNEDVSIALAVMVAEAYLYAVKDKAYTKAIDKTEEIINLSKIHFSMHSEILGVLAKTIFEFKLQPNTYNGIITLADNLIDRSLISYDSKNQSKGYHLKAIALCKQKRKSNEAYTNFKYGLKILENKKYLSVSDEALIWDAAAFSKQQEDSCKTLAFSTNVRNKMNEYNKFEKFLEDREMMNLFTVFADNEYNFPA